MGRLKAKDALRLWGLLGGHPPPATSLHDSSSSVANDGGAPDRSGAAVRVGFSESVGNGVYGPVLWCRKKAPLWVQVGPDLEWPHAFWAKDIPPPTPLTKRDQSPAPVQRSPPPIAKLVGTTGVMVVFGLFPLDLFPLAPKRILHLFRPPPRTPPPHFP